MYRLTCFCPKESDGRIRGPERGFYSILRYMVTESPMPPTGSVEDERDGLILAEINLCRYAEAPLPERALRGVGNLLHALRSPDRGIIVRFLYDWDGRSLSTEPKSLDRILGHMEQLGPLLRDNAEAIFLSQGLFIGSWGEMHGSRFLRQRDLRRLYSTFMETTGGLVRPSVRTPALWRSVTGAARPPDGSCAEPPPLSLPGLFNDGMLGSESDLGTYAEEPSARERELAFQNQLCRLVPNGGEAVGTGPRSDPEAALDSLSRMHVSYLNRGYDGRTLDKWRSAVIREPGLWQGRSFFDYVEAHLGYRFVIREASLRRSPFSGTLTARVTLENTGFAPIYHNTEAWLVFAGEGGEISFPMTGSLFRLSCGMGVRAFEAKLLSPEARLGAGTFDVYFRLTSCKYGVVVPTANQSCSALGCPIGRYFGK